MAGWNAKWYNHSGKKFFGRKKKKNKEKKEDILAFLTKLNTHSTIRQSQCLVSTQRS